MNLIVRLIMPWRLPAWADFTLPEAVNENRFLAADLVFIFGIFFSLIEVNIRLGNAMVAGRTDRKRAV
jgi:hypothetical protein